MNTTHLTAIAPIDGRYNEKTKALRHIFSEFGLMHFRVLVEIRWLQTLAKCTAIKEIPNFDTKTQMFLNRIIENFSEKDAKHIKKIEEITNHDLKAVEYFLKEKLQQQKKLSKASEFIHFACTSEDINNLAYSLMLQEALHKPIKNLLKQILSELTLRSKQYATIPMLSRTHGQPATPTTIGKEFANYTARLQRQYRQIMNIPLLGKLNGAVGNYNAHRVAYPKVKWLNLSKQFVESLGLTWNPLTTQIEPHDALAELLQAIMRWNTILIALCRDLWGYISLGYFKQKSVKNEVGSSVMPHKINPIDFENAEGNLGLSNAIFDHLANKLPISRWQRDLTDSTVLRNLGVGFAYAIIAYQSLLKGLSKIILDEKVLLNDLDDHWEVLSEAIQTVMRRYNLPKPYEKLKKLTRGEKIDQKTLKRFIDSLNLPTIVKEDLKKLTPRNYLGFSVELTNLLK